MQGDSIACCIGCGCDDLHACPGGCSWLRVDYKQGQGVCSKCPDQIQQWDRDRANRDPTRWQNQLGRSNADPSRK